jgi:hypothetical protein
MKRIALAAVGAAAAIALIAAPPAVAGTYQDASFLELAAEQSFHSTSGGADLIEQAHGVSNGLDNVPTSWHNVSVAAEAIAHFDPMLRFHGAQEFVSVAVASYCPSKVPAWTAAQEWAAERGGLA